MAIADRSNARIIAGSPTMVDAELWFVYVQGTTEADRVAADAVGGWFAPAMGVTISTEQAIG